MKIVDAFVKRLFSLRKVMWLFLCGMLFIPGEALAQQADQRDKGPVDNGGATITRPHMVKYGPPPSYLRGLENRQAPEKGPAGEPGTKGKAKGDGSGPQQK